MNLPWHFLHAFLSRPIVCRPRFWPWNVIELVYTGGQTDYKTAAFAQSTPP